MKFVSVTSTSVTVPARPVTAMSDGYGAAGAVDVKQPPPVPEPGMRIPVLLENVAADAGPASAANAAAHATPAATRLRPCSSTLMHRPLAAVEFGPEPSSAPCVSTQPHSRATVEKFRSIAA